MNVQKLIDRGIVLKLIDHAILNYHKTMDGVVVFDLICHLYYLSHYVFSIIEKNVAFLKCFHLLLDVQNYLYILSINDKIKILASHSENRIISMNKPNSDRMLNEDEKQNEAEGNQEEVSVDNIDISRSRQDTKIHPKLFTISDAIKSFG